MKLMAGEEDSRQCWKFQQAYQIYGFGCALLSISSRFWPLKIEFRAVKNNEISDLIFQRIAFFKTLLDFLFHLKNR